MRVNREGLIGSACVLGFAFSLTLAAGCYTVDFSETTYPVATTPCRMGPGGAEGELFDCVCLERKDFSGERITVGLFPAHPFFLDGLDIGPVGGTVAYAIWVPVGNLFFALPTICSVLVEPFVQTDPDRKVKDGDILSVGLVGAFRWKTFSHVETEEKYHERALMDGRYSVDLARIPKATSDDGTRVYFEYPGYRTLKRDVDADGAVDVVFADGSRVRRFGLSDEDGSRLTFEDRDIFGEPAVAAWFGRYCEWKSLLLQVKRLRYAKGYAAADVALKAEIDSFASELERILGSIEEQEHRDLKACRERQRAFARRLGSENTGKGA